MGQYGHLRRFFSQNVAFRPIRKNIALQEFHAIQYGSLFTLYVMYMYMIVRFLSASLILF